MSSYENAPATLLLATHCAACARPLVDSVSVEAGMGPVCRQRYGVAEGASDADREAANKIVHEIARLQSGDRVVELVGELRALGFAVLADRVTKRLAGCPVVEIEREGSTLVVKTPYREEALVDFRAIPGRRWDRDRKVNTFPASSAVCLYEVLKVHFHGETATGPKGLFIIGG